MHRPFGLFNSSQRWAGWSSMDDAATVLPQFSSKHARPIVTDGTPGTITCRQEQQQRFREIRNDVRQPGGMALDRPQSLQRAETHLSMFHPEVL
jgi:hypothetical protein